MKNTSLRGTTLSVPEYTRSERVFHSIIIMLNSGLTVWGFIWAVCYWGNVNPPWYVLITSIIIGYFLGDFFSGVLHWLFDTWFDENTSFAKRIVCIVREHHIYPQAIFKYTFKGEAGSASWASLVITLPVYIFVTIPDAPPTLLGYAAIVTCIVISLSVVFMYQFHKLGHKPCRSPVIRYLQAVHVILSPHHHREHHCDNHDRRYCIVNGWANYVIDSIGFWRWLERYIQSITGAVPRENDGAWMRRYNPRSGGD
jgi:Lipid desaturase domain